MTAAPMSAVALLRHCIGDTTWCLLPVTVLEDTAGAVALRISAGTAWLAATDHSGRRVRLGHRGAWRLHRTTWTGNDLTYLLEPGRWYAKGLLSRGEPAIPVAWYVNLQRPFQRRPWGFDTLDLELDLTAPVVTGRPCWRGKDFGAFVALARRGFLSPAEVVLTLRGAAQAARELAGLQQRVRLLRLAARTVVAARCVQPSSALPADVPLALFETLMRPHAPQ